MTLVAIAAGKASADIVADSKSYTPSLRRMGHSAKVLPLPHLDAVVATQGHTAFGKEFSVGAALYMDVSSFDELVAASPDLMREVWRLVTDAHDGDELGDSTVYLVGYSQEEQSFAAWACASENDFAPSRISGLHVTPSPISLRPSELELARVVRAAPLQAEHIATWRSSPEPSLPRTSKEWLALARLVREERSAIPIETSLKVFVGGQLFRTRLQRGLIETTRLHQFNDDGEEFQRIIAGTYHPQSQVGPCGCGSGERYLDCHLAAHAEDPCMCGSQKPFRDCCRVTDAALGNVEELPIA